MSELRDELIELRRFAEAHHGDQDTAMLLHALLVDIPHRLDLLLDRLASSPPVAPSSSAGLDTLLICEKCGGREIRTAWHNKGSGGWRDRACGWHDTATAYGEHLHRYCQSCQFDWTEKVAALSPATEEPKP